MKGDSHRGGRRWLPVQSRLDLRWRRLRCETGNSASIAAIGTAQNATTTRAMVTQPAHPGPAASGLLLNITTASFLWVHDAAHAPANRCEFCEDSLKTGCCDWAGA
jgi:hypothetical protein